MTSKKKFPSIKFYLSAFILFTTLVSQQVRSQNIAVQSGSTCVGQAVYQLQMGGICATTWTITGAPAGSYTPGTQTTNSYNVIWNTAVTGAVVNASYTLQPSCGASTHVTLTVNIAPLPSTPSAPVLVGGPTVCQGNVSSQFTSTGSQSYNWSIANAGTSTISWSGSTATVTWDSNFSGTAVVSVQASNSCGAVSSAVSRSVTVTPTFKFPLQISGPTSVCSDMLSPTITVRVNNNQSDSRLGAITYQWFAGGNIVAGTSNSGGPLIGTTAVNVTQGMQIYCKVSSTVGACTSTVTSDPYTVNIVQLAPPPGIALTFSPTTPTSPTYCQGTVITFATTSGLSNYQWSVIGGGAVGSTTGSSFSVTAFSAAQLKSVSVTATTPGGGCVSGGTASASAANIPFVVIPLVTPTISISSSDVSKPVCPGTSLSFNAIISNGGSTPSLQWRIDGGNIASASGNYFSTTATYTGQKIDCILTSNATCATITTATSNVDTVTTLLRVGTPGAITGPLTTIQRGTSNYLSSASDAGSYNWSVNPPTAGSIDANGVVSWSNENAFSAATISVTANGCNGPSAASTLQVTLLPPLAGGTILSGNVSINPGSNPGRIIAGPAYGGSCSGNYQYQWQQSSSNLGPFTDIPGSSTTQTYLPGAISSTTYFRRKTACGSDIAFTNVIAVSTGAVSSTNQNYVRERAITRWGVTDFYASTQLTDPYAVRQNTAYFDGLGRPSQTVAKQASPSVNDMISTHVYDLFQRESVTLLPYTDAAGDGNFKGNAASSQYNFNLAQFPGEQYYYNQTDFEASALGRPLATRASGASWVGAGRGVLAQYLSNTINDSVRMWSIALAAGSQPVSSGPYPAGQLYKNVNTDEHGNQIVEYKDKDGHVILRKVQSAPSPNTGHTGWACSYYIYDDLNNLRCVLQPELSKIFHTVPSTTTYTVAVADLTNFVFQYTYDTRQRMASKQVPGAGILYMVYDKLDRLVMTQDGNQRLLKQWIFTKYDVLNRPVLTGILKTNVIVDQPGMQLRVDTFYAGASSTNWYEAYQGSGVHGYTNNSYPPTDTLNNYLTVTYYDNYNFKSLFTNTNSFNYLNTELDGTGGYKAQLQSANQNTMGQVTGGKVRMISTASWLKSVHYYDSTYRPIQVIADNTKGHEITTTVYDFAGKAMRTKTSLYTGQPVTWGSIVGATASGNNLSYTGSGTDWSQGAISTQTLPANTDGWVEVTLSQVSAGLMIGLGHTGPAGTGNIDYGWYVGTSQLNTHENNTNVGKGSVISGDVLRVERINGIIYYKKNGVIISFSQPASSFPLFVYASLRNNGAKIANVVVSNTFSIPSPPLVATSSFVKRFTYDQAGRLVDTWHKLNAGTEILLTHNTYNELGQLIDKKLHSTTAAATDAKQSVDYRYNIRGWLTSINNAELSNTGTNDDTGDLFGMNLAYDNDLGTGNASNLQYNGNINAIKWSSGLGLGAVKEMAYNFTYDPMNRLLNATHKQANTLNTWVAGQYHESGLGYDLNGNIKALQRNGTGGTLIDNLVYNYGTTGNQLQYVTDNAAATDKAKGFNDGNISGNDYVYDANGNMTIDKNKTIGTAITYNHLNLPEKVIKGTTNDYILYLYDATGAKQGQVLNQNSVQKFTDYIGPWVFENGQLQFVQHDEGRIVIANETKLYTNSFNAATSDMVATANVGLSTTAINGENYIKVACTANGGAVKQGVTFNNLYTVAEGERYLFRMKGYFNGNYVSLYAKGNSADLVWPGVEISKGPINETWVENTIVIPQGVTQLSLGVLWTVSSVTTDNFLLNEMEFYKLNTNATPEYQYNLKDHLGNTRVTFTTQNTTKTYAAEFETANQGSESANFNNYPTGARINTAAINAHSGNNSQYLSGGLNGQVGLAKSFAVMPGDQLQIQAYAKFSTPSSTASNLNGFATALLGAFNLAAPVTGEAGTASAALNSWGALEAGGHGDGSTASLKVFVNIILFDKNYNFLDVAYQAVSTSGALLNASYTVKEPGYAFMYISNEHPTAVDVYIDDVTMSVTPSAVIQTSDYYPFGLTFNSYSRENSVPNRWKFQGQEHVDDLGLNWDSFKWRNHQPDIGRFFGIDKLAESYYYNSPYAFSENHVVAHRELEGLEKSAVNEEIQNNTTTVNRSGSTINVSSVDQGGNIVCSTCIKLPDASKQSQVTDHSAKTLGEVAMKANDPSITVTSLKRNSSDQARVMFNNLEGKGKGQGIANQNKLYAGKPGAQVISTYVKYKALQGIASQFGGTVSNTQVKNAMESTINDIGASKVSNHASQNPNLNVMDVSPKSVENTADFVNAAKNSSDVNKFIPYPKDPGHHFEILTK